MAMASIFCSLQLDVLLCIYAYIAAWMVSAQLHEYNFRRLQQQLDCQCSACVSLEASHLYAVLNTNVQGQCLYLHVRKLQIAKIDTMVRAAATLSDWRF